MKDLNVNKSPEWHYERGETAMNELQKQVLIHLLKELISRSVHETCDEGEINGISATDRKILTEMLYAHWNEEYNGEANTEFGTSSLCALALSWLEEKQP